jgi:hypothetical protein
VLKLILFVLPLGLDTFAVSAMLVCYAFEASMAGGPKRD